MAAISIELETNLLSITMDSFWNSLTVDGKRIESLEDGSFYFKQTHQGPMRFTAIGDELSIYDIASNVFVMTPESAPNGTHCAIFTYTPVHETFLEMNGIICGHPAPVPGTGPFQFSQNGMTGNFTQIVPKVS